MRRSLRITLMAAFAAIYAALSLIPAFKILGGNGSIPVSRFISPLVGIILGPILGVASVTIGGIIGTMMNPMSGLGFYSFIPGALCAFSSGMIQRGKTWIAASILSGLVVIFLIDPLNNVQPVFPYFVWLHLVALLILVSPMRKQATELFQRTKANETITAMALIIFPSTMIEQLTGSIIFVTIYGPAVWSAGMLIMLAFPIERTIITVGGSIIGAALLKSLHAAGINITR